MHDVPGRHPHTSVVVDRAGSRIHAWVTGPADGPLIVLTHGAAMDHRMFDPQVGPLVAAGYRVLTWDLRGHGDSQPLGRTPILVGDMVDDLRALLEHLDARGPVCAGGQSLGGYVTQELAFRHPSRVSAMVIVGSTCITLPIPWWERLALRSSVGWFAVWPWAHFRRTITRATALTPAVQTYAAEAASRISKRDFIRVWAGLSRSLHAEPGYRIDVPLLLTHGDADRTGNVARTAGDWARRDPRCRYEVIPRASHNANQDNPPAFNRVLLDFLAEHYPAARS